MVGRPAIALYGHSSINGKTVGTTNSPKPTCTSANDPAHRTEFPFATSMRRLVVKTLRVRDMTLEIVPELKSAEVGFEFVWSRTKKC